MANLEVPTHCIHRTADDEAGHSGPGVVVERGAGAHVPVEVGVRDDVLHTRLDDFFPCLYATTHRRLECHALADSYLRGACRFRTDRRPCTPELTDQELVQPYLTARITCGSERRRIDGSSRGHRGTDDLGFLVGNVGI